MYHDRGDCLRFLDLSLSFNIMNSKRNHFKHEPLGAVLIPAHRRLNRWLSSQEPYCPAEPEFPALTLSTHNTRLQTHTHTRIKIIYENLEKMFTRGRRDSSEVKSSFCSCRGPRFGPQNPHGGSQPPVIPVLRDLISSSDIEGSSMHAVHIYTPRHTHIR